jgi:excinuclease UvrABC helicase subunit UvrB
MNVMARALFKIQEEEEVPSALRILHGGVKAVEDLPPIDGNQIYEFERTRSLKSLQDLVSQLEAHVPRRVALENELERAVREENYERAATLRDELAGLRNQVKEE